MPKLNTTIDNLELKSNKVIGATPSAGWTDAQYPSAKTLYSTYTTLNSGISSAATRCTTLETTCNNLVNTCNALTSTTAGLTTTCNNLTTSYNSLNTKVTNFLNIAHPVGSVMITSTNANPASTVGGTWTLVDKGFKDTSGYITSTHWTAGTGELVGDQGSLFLLKDHIISLRLNLKNTEALTDTTSTIGTLKLNALGISSLALSVVSDVTASDGGQCTISYAIGTSGTVTSTDVLTIDGKHSLAAGNTFSIHLMQAISYPEMLDAYCDKFYWKRTA